MYNPFSEFSAGYKTRLGVFRVPLLFYEELEELNTSVSAVHISPTVLAIIAEQMRLFSLTVFALASGRYDTILR
jgi:hypothetical protein